MQLGQQLGAIILLTVMMTLAHGLGVVLLTRLLRLEDQSLRTHRVDHRAFGLLVTMTLSLFALHVVEIGLFALFYLGVGALGTFEAALYFSAASYATLGHPEMDFPVAWRLVGAFEGLVGFLLIGWSTAVLVTDMNKLLRK